LRARFLTVHETARFDERPKLAVNRLQIPLAHKLLNYVHSNM